MSAELIVVGGFLGAGKTTSILKIAGNLLGCGKKVGIVTNDQGSDLVDTNFLRQSGLSVLEVTGGCFCCNFEEFVSKIQTLAESEMPDVILAEPVGSCTDLIATIFKPIQLKYMSKVLLKPLSVVADPKRMQRLMLEQESDFHSEINYLFEKQLEEADIIVLNKIDRLSEREIDNLKNFIKQRFKNAEVISVSAKDGTNIEQWVNRIYQGHIAQARTLDIDYTLYGDAEARLGWLNLTSSLKAVKAIDINKLIEEVMNVLKLQFTQQGFEIAHLKIYGVSQEGWSKASITSIHDSLDFSKKAEKASEHWNMIINARIDAEPEALQGILEKVFYETMKMHQIEVCDLNMQCFKPGRPNPTYRIQD